MKIAACKDYFNGEDTDKWHGFDTDRRVVDSRLEIDCNNSHRSLYTKDTYDLRDSEVFVEAIQVPNIGNGSTSTSLLVEKDSDNGLSIGWENGRLKMGYIVDGVEDSTTIPYSATSHRWWRIRLDGDTHAYWETSPDSQTWTVRRSKTITINMESVTVLLQAGHSQAESNPGKCVYSNLNRPCVIPPVESGWVIGDISVIPNAPTGNIVFEDTFEGDTLDKTKWDEITWRPGYVNNELQAYKPGHAEVSCNTLTLRATKENGKWVSGRLHLKLTHHRKYGRFQAWVKVPHAKGAWPAFWLLGTHDDQWPECGEIDILENINTESMAYATVHGGNGHGEEWMVDMAEYPLDTSDWHLYSMDVRQGKITLYIDRTLVGEVTPDDMPDGGIWPFDSNKYFIVLNLAIGGDWPGSPDSSTPSTLEMQVREVRIYN